MHLKLISPLIYFYFIQLFELVIYKFMWTVYICCYINRARICPHVVTLPPSVFSVMPYVKSLFGSVFSTRVKKLRETLVAVQQLDKNMSSLRSWLAHIETELSRPIVYDTCDDQEIQRKLNQQQASGTTHKAILGYKAELRNKCNVWPMWYMLITCGNLPQILPDTCTYKHLHPHKQAHLYFVSMYFSVNTKLQQNNMTRVGGKWVTTKPHEEITAWLRHVSLAVFLKLV